MTALKEHIRRDGSVQRMDMPQGIEARMQAFKASSEALAAIDPLDASIVVKALAVIWL